ncbi:hypothetical protein NCS57_00960400 [Fusarium keratoplasticum]|uniref:Uncharacterized protein n=1 Tax=Fusarium keratoplasticum TaxID=1328300 RepID=A0ACC0QS12_9HYPO|nr:hypothetical protein NCS57_00960400 [Fusarium keratoplasticum]KAI8663589.1 hypothetical protein NCS57_00960400 [Fusarium keratoplasticum]KAI8664235.1 hypothetical protein NCS55_00931700 [Fusarium keratoplasticum]
MVSQPIRNGSGKHVMLYQQLPLEENAIQDNDGMTGMAADLPGSTDSADTETQRQAPKANPQSPEVATIVSAITTAYANGQLTRKDILEMLTGQLEARWQTIREYDQDWRERSRNRNAAWMSTSEWVTSSEWTTPFKESDNTEIDCLRAVVGERNYLSFRRDEQNLALSKWLVDPNGCASTCLIRAEETVLKRHKLFRDLLDKMIYGLVCIAR